MSVVAMGHFSAFPFPQSMWSRPFSRQLGRRRFWRWLGSWIGAKSWPLVASGWSHGGAAALATGVVRWSWAGCAARMRAGNHGRLGGVAAGVVGPGQRKC